MGTESVKTNGHILDGPIKPVTDKELPEEFKRFEKILGLEQHVYNIILKGFITHAFSAYYLLYLLPFGIVSPLTMIAAMFFALISGLGTTVGSHRYWTHKTFKANKPLQYLLMLMQTGTMHLPIFKWCRDHRVHHKYTDTNADPHSAARGFWFSHITWLFQPRHPDLEKSLKIIDISDLAEDPVVRFQSRHYWKLILLTVFLIPMGVTHLFFPEMTLMQHLALNFARCALAFHCTFFVNSAAHMFGDRPYDKYISASENLFVAIFAAGEGWHNYHHTFPWDYKAAEFGFRYNLSTVFIHFFAYIGWAWDLKTVSHKLLVDRINRTGDGTHQLSNHVDDKMETKVTENLDDSHSPACWGWGDKELRKEDIEITETRFPSKIHRG